MKHLSLRDIDVKDKTVLVRVDYNLPMDEDGNVLDLTRIEVTLPTIKYLLDNNAKIVLVSHLGRPNGWEEKLKNDVVAKVLSQVLGKEVIKIDGCVEDHVFEKIAALKPGEIALLENVRFYPEEKHDDENVKMEFAGKLARLADIYVNDAFGVSHREHASVAFVPKHIPGCCGFGLENEISTISSVLNSPTRPYVLVLGGKKKDKIKVLSKLIEKLDAVVIGGVVGNTFLKAAGKEIGASKYEENLVDKAREILEKHGDKIHLPVDATVVCNDGTIRQVDIQEVGDGMKIMDIGPKTVERFGRVVRDASTIVWAGPLGAYERDEFIEGSRKLAEIIAELEANVIVGGGDTAAAMKKIKFTNNNILHISTGGGAFIEFITELDLPGLAALRESYMLHADKILVLR